ncbi:MAG: hypothetical protein RIR62_1232 [Pseudomonadota bacterium]
MFQILAETLLLATGQRLQKRQAAPQDADRRALYAPSDRTGG